MELHFKYLEAVQQADKRIEGEKHVSISPFPPIPRCQPLNLSPRPSLCAVSSTLALYHAACWMNAFTCNTEAFSVALLNTNEMPSMSCVKDIISGYDVLRYVFGVVSV